MRCIIKSFLLDKDNVSPYIIFQSAFPFQSLSIEEFFMKHLAGVRFVMMILLAAFTAVPASSFAKSSRPAAMQTPVPHFFKSFMRNYGAHEKHFRSF